MWLPRSTCTQWRIRHRDCTRESAYRRRGRHTSCMCMTVITYTLRRIRRAIQAYLKRRLEARQAHIMHVNGVHDMRQVRRERALLLGRVGRVAQLQGHGLACLQRGRHTHAGARGGWDGVALWLEEGRKGSCLEGARTNQGYSTERSKKGTLCEAYTSVCD